MNRGRWLVASLVAATALAGAWVVLGPKVVVGEGSGDWLGACSGLRRALAEGSLRGGPRAVVHFHDLAEPARVEILISALPGAAPLPVSAWTRGGRVFSGPLTRREQVIAADLPAGPGLAEVWIEARPAALADGSVFRIREIVLARRRGARAWAGLLLPALLALAVVAALWAREGTALAAGAGLVAAALGLALWLTLVDPVSALRFAPLTRGRLCLVLLAAVWGVALRRPGRFGAVAIAASVGILYLPTLGYGFVYDDFAFAHPWSLRELLGTLWGSWDPRGLSTDYYRPVAAASLSLGYRIWGTWTPGYHLTNLLLQGLLGWLVLRLLLRLGLPCFGALAGALAWTAHPLGATAASWVNDRTDGLVAIFYVGALAALLRPRMRTGLVLLLYAAALGSKELAVTWPLTAALCLWLAGSEERRQSRIRAVRLAVLLTLAYLVLWASLFPQRLVARLDEARVEGAGLSPQAAVRLVPSFFATVFSPGDYVSWWQQPLAGASVPWLLSGLALPVAAWLAARRSGRLERLVALGSLWPVLTALPMLGMAGLDLFGKGLLLCVGFGVLWSVLTQRLAERSARLAVALALVPAFWLGSLTRSSSSAWGPGGYLWERNTRWTRHQAEWQAGLTPEMRRLFREQVEAVSHDERWIRSGRRD